MTTSTVAITKSCDKLALPITAPNEINTAAAQKSATNKLKFKLIQKIRLIKICMGVS